MNEQRTAFPLYWPDNWPRTAAHQRKTSAFGGSQAKRPSMERAVQSLAHELDLLKATDCMLSTNVRRRMDGAPYSAQAQPADVGAAVFFKLKGRDVSLACDKWSRVECNVYAIAKHVEALRGQERWGVGNVEQAFRGYMALPAVGQASGDNPWSILGVSINASETQILEAYRVLAKKFHPDIPETGDNARFRRIKDAYDLLSQTVRQQAA